MLPDKKRLKVLFLPAWYPSELNPVGGIFVGEHAKAPSVLVRTTNKVVSSDEAASSLIDVVAARHRPYYGLTRLLVKALFWGRIRRRLRAFHRGEPSLKDRRLAVRDTMQ